MTASLTIFHCDHLMTGPCQLMTSVRQSSDNWGRSALHHVLRSYARFQLGKHHNALRALPADSLQTPHRHRTHAVITVEGL